MNLCVQIKVLIISFVYGILIAYIIKSQYKYFFQSKPWYKLILNSLFVFDIITLYFLILRLINHGTFHIYFLFLIILGFLLGNKLMDS